MSHFKLSQTSMKNMIERNERPKSQWYLLAALFLFCTTESVVEFADRGVVGLMTTAEFVFVLTLPTDGAAVDELLLWRVGVVLAEFVIAEEDIALVCEHDIDSDDDVADEACLREFDATADLELLRTRELATSANSGAVLNIYTQHSL